MTGLSNEWSIILGKLFLGVVTKPNIDVHGRNSGVMGKNGAINA